MRVEDGILLDAMGAYEECLYQLRIAYERLMLSRGEELPDAREAYLAAVDDARRCGELLRGLRQAGHAS